MLELFFIRRSAPATVKKKKRMPSKLQHLLSDKRLLCRTRTWFSLHFVDTWVWGTKAPRFRLCTTTVKTSSLPLEHPLLLLKPGRSFLQFWVCLLYHSQSSSLQLYLFKSNCVFSFFFSLRNVQLEKLGLWVF